MSWVTRFIINVDFFLPSYPMIFGKKFYDVMGKLRGKWSTGVAGLTIRFPCVAEGLD
jgi:hypothetical protein